MAYTADKEPDQLTALTTLDAGDVFVVGDISDSSEVAKCITKANLKTDLGLTGTNTGDQTSIVGITGTKAQFDAAVTDGNFMYNGDAPTSHTHTLASITDVTASATELNYVDGVTSAVQTQLDAKLATSTYDDATSGETNTGTSTTKYVSPDGLAGSNLGIRYISVALNGTTALTTSEKAYFRIPAAFTGMNLVSVAGAVGTGASGSSSSGLPTFTVKNVTDSNQMLSTSLTIDANEYTSSTAATPAVINGSFDDVVTDDLIEVAVTTAGTGVTYAVVTCGFQLP